MIKMRKNFIITFLILCVLLSSLYFGVQSVRAADEMNAVTIELNVNNAGKTYSAKELIEAGGYVINDTDNVPSFANYGSTGIPYITYDNIMFGIEYNGSGTNSTIKITPNLVGKATLKVKMNWPKTGESEHTITINMLAKIPDGKKGTVETLVVGDPNLKLYQGVRTTVDLVSNVPSSRIISFIPLKGILSNALNIRSFENLGRDDVGLFISSVEAVNKDELDVIFDKSITGGANSKSRVSFDVILKKPVETVTVAVVLAASNQPTDIWTINMMFTISSVSAGNIALKSIEDVTQKISGKEPKTLVVHDLFDGISGLETILVDTADIIYNEKVITVEKIKGDDGSVKSIKITPISKGYTSISIPIIYKGVTDQKMIALIPAEVRGFYSFVTEEGFTNQEISVTTMDQNYTMAGEDGYVFHSVVKVDDESIATAQVVGGRLIVKSFEKGSTVVNVRLYNPLYPQDESSMIVAAIPVTFVPYNFFTTLTTTGIIFFSIAAVIVLLVILFIVLSIVGHFKKKREDKIAFDKQAAKKFAHKKELQERTRQSQVRAIQSSILANSMYRGDMATVGINGYNTPAPSNALQLDAKGPMLLTTANETRSAVDERQSRAKGSEEAERFMREIQEKSRTQIRKPDSIKPEDDRVDLSAQDRAQPMTAKQAKVMFAEEKRQRKQDDIKEKKFEGKRYQALSAQEVIVDIMAQNMRIKKLVFAKNYDLKCMEMEFQSISQRLPTVKSAEEMEHLQVRLADIRTGTQRNREELANYEMDARKGEVEKENKIIAMNELVFEDELAPFKAQLKQNRDKIAEDLDADYNKYVADYMQDANTSQAIQDVERMKDDMRRQAEKAKIDEHNLVVDAKVQAFSDLEDEVELVSEMSDIVTIESRLSELREDLKIEEAKDDRIVVAVAKTSGAIKERKNELALIEKQKREEAERKEQEEKAKREKAGASVEEINSRLIEAFKSQIEADKQIYKATQDNARMAMKIKRATAELMNAVDDVQAAKIQEEIAHLNVLITRNKQEISAIEQSLDNKAEQSIADQNKMFAIIDGNGLDNLRRELEFRNENSQREMQADYDRFTTDYKNEMEIQEQLEEAERIRKKNLEELEVQRRQALADAIAAKQREITKIAVDAKECKSSEELGVVKEKIVAFESGLAENERVDAVKSAISASYGAVSKKEDELRKKAEKEAKVQRELADIRSKIMGIKEQIPDINSIEMADKLMKKTEMIEDDLDKEHKTERIENLLSKCKDAIRHAKEILMLKARKKKKIIKKTVTVSGGKKKSSAAKSSSSGKKKSSSSGSKSGAKKKSSSGTKKSKRS